MFVLFEWDQIKQKVFRKIVKFLRGLGGNDKWDREKYKKNINDFLKKKLYEIELYSSDIF